MVFVAKEYLVAVGTDTLLIMTDVAVTAANVKTNELLSIYVCQTKNQPKITSARFVNTEMTVF